MTTLRLAVLVVVLLTAGCSGADDVDGYFVELSSAEAAPAGVTPVSLDADCLRADGDDAVFQPDPHEVLEEAVTRVGSDTEPTRVSLKRGQFVQFRELFDRCGAAVHDGTLYVRANGTLVVVRTVTVNAA